MVLPSIPGFPRIETADLRDFPDRPEAPTAVLTADRSCEEALTRLSSMHGPKLVAAEVWRELLPHSGVLISSAISGGSLRHRFSDAAQQAPKRCWLLLEPMTMEFPLPCICGSGKRITIINYEQQFYSETLLCMYSHFIRSGQGVLVLWDTEYTLRKKMELAKACGFLGYVQNV